MINLLIAEEWEIVTAKLVVEFDKELKKVKEEITKNISDKEKINKIEDAFLDFNTVIKGNIKANMERTLSGHQTFRNMNATSYEL